MSHVRHRVVFCVLPSGAAHAVEAVREHYATTDPGVEVHLEHRGGERRRPERVAARAERRHGTDRRRPAIPRRLPPLPPALTERTGAVRWYQRLPPVGAATERLSTGQVVAAVRARDGEAATELYWRCYLRMHSRLVVLLGEAGAADEAAPRAFGRVLDALDDPFRAAEPFEDLLYAEVDATAADGRGPGWTAMAAARRRAAPPAAPAPLLAPTPVRERQALDALLAHARRRQA